MSAGSASSPGSIAAQAGGIDNTGTNKFYNGVTTLAQGIAELSQAKQLAQDPLTAAQAPGLETDALDQIAQGFVAIDNGRQVVGQANTVRENQANLASAGIETGLTTHKIAFDAASAPASTLQALDDMEKATGISSSSVINAVNQGNKDQIAKIAAGSGDVSADSILAAISGYMGHGPIDESSDVNRPNTPTLSAESGPPGADVPTEPVKSSDGTVPAGHRLEGNMTSAARLAAIAAAVRRGATLNRHPSSSSDPLEPLGTDQFFRETSLAAAELGSPDQSLFLRVHGQYNKRRPELRRTGAGPRKAR